MLKVLFFISLISSPYFLRAQGNAYDRTPIVTYFQNMDFENGLNWLKKQSIDGYNKAYLMDVGYCYYMLEMPIEARDNYKKIYEVEPLDFHANLFLATIYDNLMYMKDDSAVVHYKNLVAIQPQQAKFWYQTGLAFNRVKEYDSAFVYLEKAFELKPSSGNITVAYANALQRKKVEVKAEKIIDAFLKTDSSDANVIDKKIEMSHRKKEHTQVVRWGENLRRDSVVSFYSYMYLAYAYFNTKEIEKSISLCNWMNENNMGTEHITYCLALCYSEKGDYVRSNSLLDECILINLQDQARTYFRAKADNYALMKLYPKAVKEMDTSYYIFHDPVDLYLAGKIYDDQKNKAKASIYYKKYLSENKKPASPLEVKLENYMKEYLKAD